MDAGYFEQSRRIRTTQRITGFTPDALGMQFPNFGVLANRRFAKAESGSTISGSKARSVDMTQWLIRSFFSVLMLACSAFANDQTRGELLYTTHCVSCHTTQVHWRAEKRAIDWDSLKLQVRRWQGNAGLQWREADITEVSRYLNETIYRFPPPAERIGLVAPPKSSMIPQTP